MHPLLVQVNNALSTQGKCLVQLLVRTDCPTTEIREVRADGSIKMDVSAPPIDGQANRAICRYLSTELGINRDSVQIIRGTSQSHKLVLIKKA